jgi:hypothetical protein
MRGLLGWESWCSHIGEILSHQETFQILRFPTTMDHSSLYVIRQTRNRKEVSSAWQAYVFGTLRTAMNRSLSHWKNPQQECGLVYLQ